MKKRWNNHKCRIICLVSLLVLAAGLVQGCSLGGDKRSARIEKKSKMLQELVDTYYLNDADEDEIEDNLYKGIINGLDDPYSVYYTKEEYEQLQEETSGTYVGIGVSVRQDTDTGYIKVVKAFDGGSAKEVGVSADDYIIKVAGEDIKGEELDTVVSKIKGEEGTTVDVTFLRASDGKEVTYTIERRSVDVPTIAYEMLDNKIGYIQVTEFDQVTADQYISALEDLENQGEKALIVDVRDNPGGVLGTVVTMLQHMLPEGTIVYTEDKDGKGDTYTSDGTNEFKKPLVVLVNGNSASAAEIFTGAIKDYGIGTIIGTTTFGKGIVQKIFPLSDGSAVKLTVSKYYTPSGVCIHGEGIEPDITLEYDASLQTSGTYSKDDDNQLQKAIEVLEKEIK